MQPISAPLASSDPSLPEIAIAVDRRTLNQCSWRGSAEDGREFAFALAAPLRHGEVVFQTGSARYAIRQRPESVLEIALEVAPSAAAGIGWAIGNLHAELAAEPGRLLTPDVPPTRHLLDRLRVAYRAGNAVFRPGRFARGESPLPVPDPGHRH
ncbi:MAG: urease accessory protein UreE [Verrucomicrobia bacterium]|nr:urease accessory protein UreE [Verrucomicrobiota bacterium]